MTQNRLRPPNEAGGQPESEADVPMSSVPLYVDLDGTVLKTDTLWECLLVFVRRFPLRIPVMLLIAFRGKPTFKAYLADHVRLDSETLPYKYDVLEYLASERADRRQVVLARRLTVESRNPSRRTSNLFDDVIATDAP